MAAEGSAINSPAKHTISDSPSRQSCFSSVPSTYASDPAENTADVATFNATAPWSFNTEESSEEESHAPSRVSFDSLGDAYSFNDGSQGASSSKGAPDKAPQSIAPVVWSLQHNDEEQGACVGFDEGVDVDGFAEGDGVGRAVGFAVDGLGDGPGVGAATGAGSDDGAAVPNSSAPAQFVPEPVPAGAGAAALSAAVAAQAGAASPESAQQLSSIVVKSTSTLYNVPSLPAT